MPETYPKGHGTYIKMKRETRTN